VGIVSDLRLQGARDEPAPAIYVPLSQHETWPHLTTVVRVRPGAPNPGRVVAAAIHQVDPAMPTQAQMASIKEFDGNAIATQRFTLFLFGVFSVVALLLAALGIFGVMAYTVSQRTKEIGVRLALGARRIDVLRLVLGQALRLVGIGLILGLAGAWAGARFLSSVLHGVSSQDPLTFVAIPAGLALIAAVACYLPARRAVDVNPIVALRTE
jgi:putative ABC transport system permease protein